MNIEREIKSVKKKLSIAVLASGRGSNFRAIAEAIRNGKCDAEVKVLITNNTNAGAIDVAKASHIPVEVVDRKQFESREAMDDHIKQLLDRYCVELVVLAGYMLLIKSKSLLSAYRNRIINIHPALLPAFPGEDAQKQAFGYGAKISGLTIHFVDESLDAGPIIYQEAVDITDCESWEGVSDRILACEHIAYPKVIDMFALGKFVVQGRRVQYERV